MTTTQHQRIEAPSQALHSDGLSRFVRAGAWAAIASGLALAASLVVEWLVVPFEKLGEIETYLTGSYLLSSGLRLLGGVLLLWGLIGIYGRQSRAAGTFGLWALVVAFLGTAIQAGNTWAEVFVWPTLAQVAPNILLGHATEAPVYLMMGIFLSGLLSGIGIIVAPRNLIGNTIYLLLTHPDQLDQVRSERGLLRKVIEEMLRFEPPVTLIPRIALEDFELRGNTIRQGQIVQFSIASANRDEAEFPDPDRFDIMRKPGKVLSFGHGPHGCLHERRKSDRRSPYPLSCMNQT